VSDEMKYNIDNSVAVSLDKAGECVLNAVLKDQIKKRSKKIPVKITASNGAININVKGYGDQEIITLEVCEGHLRLVIWADKNQDTPSHIIGLEGANLK
jgi:uncharacterized protein with ATP-grasp and redox domains